jgi:acyl-CoA synthetase (AMP-forming)/AMP-acid ligase II
MIRKACAEKLPEFAVPKNYCFREKLTLTPVGKIDFMALEREAEQ